ncbi:MAG: hypothetical protein IT435_12165 [Phycisphaerales bacterium]|nr:hypothetical protein [Phycisphaerales bacterium]
MAIVLLIREACREFKHERCGAWGYLSKNDDVPRLIEGIRRAGRGEMALSKEVEAVWRSEVSRLPPT